MVACRIARISPSHQERGLSPRKDGVRSGRARWARPPWPCHGGGNQSADYHTWDDPEFRRRWTKDPKSLVEATVGARSLLVLDELHKAPRWKNYLKGLYDLRGEFADIIVTGSARLDLFRRGGDSLPEEGHPSRDCRAFLRGTAVNHGQMANFALCVHASWSPCTQSLRHFAPLGDVSACADANQPT